MNAATALDRTDLRGAILDGVDLRTLTFRNTRIDIEHAAQLATMLGARVGN